MRCQQVGVFVNKPRTESDSPLNMQSELTVLQGAIHDFMNFKHEFEQTRIFILNKYIIKMAYVQIE